MKLQNDEQLAAHIAATGATIVICEADQCKGAVLEAGLTAIASTRGDPTNVGLCQELELRDRCSDCRQMLRPLAAGRSCLLFLASLQNNPHAG